MKEAGSTGTNYCPLLPSKHLHAFKSTVKTLEQGVKYFQS